MSAQIARDLRAAADAIERDGWTQDVYHRGCRHCALGAIAVVTGYHDVPGNPVEDLPDLDEYVGGRPGDAAAAMAHFLGGLQPVTVADWNDAPGRTADEVIAALRAAADRAEAGQ